MMALRALMARTWTVRQAMGLMLACVVLPGALGAAVLVVSHWTSERDKARAALQDEAVAIARSVDRDLDVGLAQLQAIAAARALDDGDWADLHAFAAAVVRDRPGHLVALTAPGGLQLFNSALPLGQGRLNLWALEAENRQVDWNGRSLPVSSQGLTRQVFRTAAPAYSNLYIAVSLHRPTLGMAIPVIRANHVAYALTLSFPADALLAALRQVREDRQVAVVDATGHVIAALGPGAPSTGDLLEGPPAGDLVVETATARGYTVRLSAPTSIALAGAVRVTSAWALLALLAVLASVLLAMLFSRWVALPLQALGRAVRHNAPLPAGTDSLRVAEVEQLRDALASARDDNRRATAAEAARAALEQEQRVLRASEAHLRRVLDGLYAFVGVLDLDGTLLEVNLPPVQRAALGREEVIGRPFWDCPWWNWSPQVQQRLREAIANAREGCIERYDVEVRLEDGQLVTIDFQLAPLRDEQGRITHLIPSATDVQARVQAARALMVSEAMAQRAAAGIDAQRRLLDAILEATPVGMLVQDPAGRLLHMNSAHRVLWGLEPSQADARVQAWRGWWVDGERAGMPLGAEEWPLARARQEARGVAETVEIEPLDAPGQRKVVLMRAAPVLDGQGLVVGAVVAQMDMTERTRAEAALREADRQKDIFLATLGHELRNPLAPIRTAAEIIRRRAPDDLAVVRARESIERQVTHLARLVDDLLDVSRISVGALQLREDTLDLRELVAGTVEAVRSSMGASRSIALHPVPATPVWVRGDATRLSQALLNVLNNACKFTGQGGRIEVVMACEAGQVQMLISDDGVGLRPEACERIFGLFAQEQKSGLGGNQGLGIGLALSRQLVRLHGGELTAASPGPGQGSTFLLRLPLAAVGVEPPVAAPAAAQRRAPQGATVLVVDDNRDSCDLLAQLLEADGLRVLRAYSGQEALQLHAQAQPDLLVLDIGLPDIDGYAVCRRIRAARPRHPPALVALTGWGQSADKAAARAAGFDVHLTKPVDPAELERAIRSLLAARTTLV